MFSKIVSVIFYADEKKNIVSGLNKTMNDRKNRDGFAKPSLYASIVETESKLRRIAVSSRLDPSLDLEVSSKAGTREVNFPLSQKVYNYANMVDVGLNSGSKAVAKPKPREFPTTRKPGPKLSDYYRPSFDNVQRIRMSGVETTPELTVQFDGMAVSKVLNEIDDLIFR